MTDWAKLHSEHFVGTRVLVTGGAGFIGSHLVEALLKLGAEVVAFDDLSTGNRENIEGLPRNGGRLAVVEASILDQTALSKAIAGCRYVFHEAAMVEVPASIERPDVCVDINVVGTQRVLEAARQAGVERVMFAGSCAVYGNLPELPKREGLPTDAPNPYAASKLAGEALMQAYASCYDLDTAALRYFNIFGPRQSATSAYAGVIAAFAKRSLAGQPITIHGDGRQSRDFTFVDNVVHANLLAARSRRPMGGRPINVGCARQVSIGELATMMMQMFGQAHHQPTYGPPRDGDVVHSLADLSRARELLGYEPIVDFEAGLRDTVQWYRAAAGQ